MVNRKILIFGLLTFVSLEIHSQQSKPALTWEIIDKTEWNLPIGAPQLSDDGEYLSYSNNSNGILTGINSNLNQVFPGSEISFIPGTDLILLKKDDTIRILHSGLAKPIIEITGNQGCKVISLGKRKELLWLLKDTFKILDLSSMREREYKGTIDLNIPENAHNLVYTELAKNNTALHLLDLTNDSNKVIAGCDGHFEMITEDQREQHIAAYAIGGLDSLLTLVYYDINTGKLQRFAQSKLCPDKMFSIERGYGGHLKFLDNGNIIVFTRKRLNSFPELASNTLASLNIWNYKDVSLPKVAIPSTYFDDEAHGGQTLFKAIINISTGRTAEINQDTLPIRDQNLQFGPENSSYVLTSNIDFTDHLLSLPPKYQITNLVTGSAQNLACPKGYSYAYPSPNGKQILFYNLAGFFYSYDVSSGHIKRLNDLNKLNLRNQYSERPDDFNYGIIGWLEGGNSILVNGKFDIWKLNLNGTPPLCITKHFGEQSKTILRLVKSGEKRLAHLNFDNQKLLIIHEMILIGESQLNRKQGIFEFNVSGKSVPKEICTGAFFLYDGFIGFGNEIYAGGQECVVKAKNNSRYAFLAATTTGSNIYMNANSTKIRQLTKLNAYKNYNWLSTQLLSWKCKNGQINQGIVYKPENYDPKKKYPVIVTYYEKNAGAVNAPIIPVKNSWAAFRENIAYFVSNGYLIFVPDVHYRIGHLRESIYQSIVPGLKELIKKPYVDAAHIGATGHSWGGFETLLLITKSQKLFAAALSENGGSDMFYAFANNPEFTVRGQLRMGVTPQKNPKQYINESAVLHVGEIETPLLLLQNNQDVICPLYYGITMFQNMRQLNKPVWLLQYKNQGHGMGRYLDKVDPDVIDYRQRVQQFFDHYLKGAPAPKWMTEGTPHRTSANGLEQSEKQ